MHYIVTTAGRMVSQGMLTLSNQTNVSVTLDSIMQGVNIYEFNISYVFSDHFILLRISRFESSFPENKFATMKGRWGGGERKYQQCLTRSSP